MLGAAAKPPLASSSASPLWLWFTVLFANFAEAMAEGRGKAQADALRKARQRRHGQEAAQTPQSQSRDVSTCQAASTFVRRLRKGDVVLVEAGDFIPATAR